jgi:quercetin dioxygenase-like cupin family protein
MIPDRDSSPMTPPTPGEGRNAADALLLSSCDHEVVRRRLAAGSSLAAPAAAHEATVFCLSGSIDLQREQGARLLTAGAVAILRRGEPYRITAREDSSVLLTVLQRDPDRLEASAN